MNEILYYFIYKILFAKGIHKVLYINSNLRSDGGSTPSLHILLRKDQNLIQCAVSAKKKCSIHKLPP